MLNRVGLSVCVVCIAVGERVRRKLIRLTMQVDEAEVESQLAVEARSSSISNSSLEVAVVLVEGSSASSREST